MIQKKCIFLISKYIKIYQNHVRLSFSMVPIGFYSDLIDICKIEIPYMILMFSEFLGVNTETLAMLSA